MHIPSLQNQVSAQTGGMGGALAWPALQRKADRLDPRNKT